MKREYEINHASKGDYLAVPFQDLLDLGLVPEWNPSAFLTGKSRRSFQGKMAYLDSHDTYIFSSVYEKASGSPPIIVERTSSSIPQIGRLPKLFDLPRPSPDPIPHEVHFQTNGEIPSTTAIVPYDPYTSTFTGFIMTVMVHWLVDEHPVQGPKLLNTSLRLLRSWLRTAVKPLSGTFYDDRTRLMWVYTSRVSFPVCPVCHREFGILRNIHLSRTYDAYQPHCSSRCAALDPSVKAKLENTSMERYGVTRPGTSEESKARRAKTNMARHGVEHALDSSEIRARIQDTCMKRHGSRTPLQNPEILEKTRETTESRYGVRNVISLPETREKMRQSVFEHFGVQYPSQSPEVQEKSRNTCLERYGVDHPSKDPAFMDRVIQSRIASQRLENRPKADGIVFDSSWEFDFYSYCIAHGKEVKYHPCRMDYEFEGTIHGYYPDFLVDGKLYEVKGDCFINPDGSWRCPFRRKGMTDEEYDRACRQIDAKRKCVQENGVTVVSGKDIKDMDSIFGGME